MDDKEVLEIAKGITDIVMKFSIESIEAIIADPALLAGVTAEGLPEFTEAERSTVLRYVHYDVRWRLHEAAQPRALALLRRFLTPGQRADLRRSSLVEVVGSAGGVFWLYPRGSRLTRTEARGARRVEVEQYCYHDDASIMPPADAALGVMLALLADEPAFLAEANASPVGKALWRREATA